MGIKHEWGSEPSLILKLDQRPAGDRDCPVVSTWYWLHPGHSQYLRGADQALLKIRCAANPLDRGKQLRLMKGWLAWAPCPRTWQLLVCVRPVAHIGPWRGHGGSPRESQLTTWNADQQASSFGCSRRTNSGDEGPRCYMHIRVGVHRVQRTGLRSERGTVKLC